MRWPILVASRRKGTSTCPVSFVPSSSFYLLPSFLCHGRRRIWVRRLGEGYYSRQQCHWYAYPLCATFMRVDPIYQTGYLIHSTTPTSIRSVSLRVFMVYLCVHDNPLLFMDHLQRMIRHIQRCGPLFPTPTTPTFRYLLSVPMLWASFGSSSFLASTNSSSSGTLRSSFPTTFPSY